MFHEQAKFPKYPRQWKIIYTVNTYPLYESATIFWGAIIEGGVISSMFEQFSKSQTYT